MNGATLRQAAKRGPQRSTRALTAVIVDILATFDGTMSTRQVFYQCVSRAAVPNCPEGYDKVQRLLVDLRRSGVVPYRRIVDRGRAKHHRRGWDSVQDALESLTKQFRRDAWADQDTIVMIALEKAALEGIFGEIVDEYGAGLWTVRGFVSVSFAFEMAEEIKAYNDAGHAVAISYFGDHDPSGLNLEKKLHEELSRHGAAFTWERRGLLWEDFGAFDLVNVPVKRGDSRAPKYLSAFGDRAAELDALPPDVLRARIRDQIEQHIDLDRWLRIREEERLQLASLRSVSANWPSVVQTAGVA